MGKFLLKSTITLSIIHSTIKWPIFQDHRACLDGINTLSFSNHKNVTWQFLRFLKRTDLIILSIITKAVALNNFLCRGKSFCSDVICKLMKIKISFGINYKPHLVKSWEAKDIFLEYNLQWGYGLQSSLTP